MTSSSRGEPAAALARRALARAAAVMLAAACFAGCQNVLFLAQERVENVEYRGEKVVSTAMKCGFRVDSEESPSRLLIVPLREETVEALRRDTARSWGYFMPFDPFLKSAELFVFPFVLVVKAGWDALDLVFGVEEEPGISIESCDPVPAGFEESAFAFEERAKCVHVIGTMPEWFDRTYRFFATMFTLHFFPFGEMGIKLGPVSDSAPGSWYMERRTRTSKVDAALQTLSIGGKDVSSSFKDGGVMLDAVLACMTGPESKVEAVFKDASGSVIAGGFMLSREQMTAWRRIAELSAALETAGAEEGRNAELAALHARWGSQDEAARRLEAAVKAAETPAAGADAAGAYYDALEARFANDPGRLSEVRAVRGFHASILTGACAGWTAFQREDLKELLFLHVASTSFAERSRGVVALARNGKILSADFKRALLIGLLGSEKEPLALWAILWALGGFPCDETRNALGYFATSMADPVLKARAYASLKACSADGAEK